MSLNTQSTAFRLRLLGLASLTGLLLAACGATADAPQAQVQAQAEAPDLPTLPPIDQRNPERFDDEGCLRTGPSESDCSTTANELDSELAGGYDESDFRTLEGFVGSQWKSVGLTGGVEVLEDSVTTSQNAYGLWQAVGLARNETGTETSIEVSATLSGPDGAVLQTVTAPASVGSVRSGEPVPFSLTAQAPGGEVASVAWSAGAAQDSGAVRSLELLEFWQRPFSDGRPVDNYLWSDAAAEGHYYLSMGSAGNVSDAAITGVTTVAAWVDENGRVLWVAEAAMDPPAAGDDLDAAPPVIEPSEVPEGPPTPDNTSGVTLEAGAAADYLLAIAPGAPPEIDDALIYLWAFA